MPKFGCFDDGQFNELDIEDHLSSSPVLASANFWYWIRKLQARFVAGDYSAAMHAASKLQHLPWKIVGVIEEADYHLYRALAHSAYCDFAPASERSQHLGADRHASQAVTGLGGELPGEFRGPCCAGRRRNRSPGRARTSMPNTCMSRPSGRRMTMALSTMKQSPTNVPPHFYRTRGFDRFADALPAQCPLLLLALGRRGKVRQLDARYPGLALADADGGAGHRRHRISRLTLPPLCRPRRLCQEKCSCPA